MENDASLALVRPTEPGEDGEERTHRVSKRGRVGEGRPTKRTPEVVATIAAAIMATTSGVRLDGRPSPCLLRLLILRLGSLCVIVGPLS